MEKRLAETYDLANVIAALAVPIVNGHDIGPPELRLLEVQLIVLHQ